MRRNIPGTDLYVSPVALGMWPIAGISSLNVNREDSVKTTIAAFEHGVNHFDTAYSYGYTGESDAVLRECFSSCWSDVVVASKVGQHYDQHRDRIIDGRPATLLRHAEEILVRLDRPYVDIMYLHCPDPKTPIAESAQAMADIHQRGWCKHVGVSNVTSNQLSEFAKVIRPALVQPPFNMLQQTTLDSLRDTINRINSAVASYWPLMKGLLSGQFERTHQFDSADRRLTYDIFNGEKWERNQDFVDVLRGIAARLNISVAQLVTFWTMHQSNIVSVLCGARRPHQIIDTANAMQMTTDDQILSEIDTAIRAFAD